MSERKIVDYKIISEPNEFLLENDVNRMIREGFILLGSPFMGVDIPFETKTNFYQAMVKYEE